MAIDVSVTLRQALEKLESDRARIDRQIVGLKQALAAGNSRDGGPMPAKGSARRGRRQMSPAQRKAVGERMKAYWAKRRGQQSKKSGRKKT